MGRMLTEQRELLGARGMFLEAIRYSPGRVDAYLYLLATLLGNRVLSSLAELKRRVTLS
jgi:hypothetical protein